MKEKEWIRGVGRTCPVRPGDIITTTLLLRLIDWRIANPAIPLPELNLAEVRDEEG